MESTLLIFDEHNSPEHSLVPGLQRAGYQVESVNNPLKMFHKARALWPDLIILNLVVPGDDDWSMCRQLRTITNAPLMIIADKGTEKTRVTSFNMGADEYLLSHVSNRVLLAKIYALLRRAARRTSASYTYLDGWIMIDLLTPKVVVNNKQTSLTPTELKLLSSLVENIGYTLSHKFLMHKVWGAKETLDSGLLRLYIRRLRLKLEPDPDNPRYIQNNHGIGYHFCDLRE